jgi:hypothetical protein
MRYNKVEYMLEDNKMEVLACLQKAYLICIDTIDRELIEDCFNKVIDGEMKINMEEVIN